MRDEVLVGVAAEQEGAMAQVAVGETSGQVDNLKRENKK